MRAITVDVDLGEHREADVVIERTEVADLGLVTRFLVAELVTGESQYHQSLIPMVAPELLQAGVLRGEAAF